MNKQMPFVKNQIKKFLKMGNENNSKYNISKIVMQH